MTPDTEKLKACPFCGAQPRDAEPHYTFTAEVWSVRCPGCKAESAGFTGARKIDAMKAWNTRAEVKNE